VIISKVNQCKNAQMWQIRDNVNRIPENRRLDLGDIIITKYVKDGGDRAIVNYALAKLGMNVELV